MPTWNTLVCYQHHRLVLLKCKNHFKTGNHLFKVGRQLSVLCCKACKELLLTQLNFYLLTYLNFETIFAGICMKQTQQIIPLCFPFSHVIKQLFQINKNKLHFILLQHYYFLCTVEEQDRANCLPSVCYAFHHPIYI